MRNAAIGILGGLILWFLSDQVWEPMLKQWVGPIKLDSLAGVRGNLLNYLALMAIAFVYGGVVEEMVFRGFVIGWGSTLFGPRSVIPLVAVVFGRVRVSAPLPGTVGSDLDRPHRPGICAALCRDGQKLLAPVLAHMVVDAIGVTQLYLGING